MSTPVQIRRRTSGAAGAPAALKGGELAYNQVDGYLYLGSGDDGAGNATSIKAVGKDDFDIRSRVPLNGQAGQILTVDGSGNVTWAAAPQSGTTYTASTGIAITGTSIAVDTNYVPSKTDLANGLATKANVAHTHVASDITSGTFDVNRIPSLDASKIGSGVLDVARIPVLPSQIVQVASGDLTTLTATQQNAIGTGTVVTTSDGFRYVYSGSGSKTSAASYTQLADVTPEWAVIANKPVFAAVATSGSYADLTSKPALATVAISGSYTDLTNKPSLGTMASQNANAVAITGGTINGVTIDGGTF